MTLNSHFVVLQYLQLQNTYNNTVFPVVAPDFAAKVAMLPDKGEGQCCPPGKQISCKTEKSSCQCLLQFGHITGWAKNGLFLRVDNFAIFNGRKARNTGYVKTFQILSRKRKVFACQCI